MFAAHYKLDNLCVIVDNNGLQIDGPVAKVRSPYPINEKLKASDQLGWISQMNSIRSQAEEIVLQEIIYS